MADYAGSPTYGANIYIPETTDQALGGLGTAFNKPNEDLADRTAWLKQGNDRMIGMIADFAAEAVPGGWLECQGQDVDRTTYASLFAIMGIIWGQRFEEGLTASEFDTIDPLTGIKINHGFSTEDAVNIKQINPNSATTMNFAGGPIADDTVVYVRAIDLDTFSIHPSASDATNNLNAATVTGSDGLEAYSVQPSTTFRLPDLRDRVTKGVGSATSDYAAKDTELAVTGGSIYAHSIKKCVKFE